MAAATATAPSSTGKTFRQSQEEFLLQHGWKKVYEAENGEAIWDDPVGSNDPPKEILAMEVTSKEGKVERTYQKCGPPIPWRYSTAQACQLQHARIDGEKKRIKDEQAKKERDEAEKQRKIDEAQAKLAKHRRQ